MQRLVKQIDILEKETERLHRELDYFTDPTDQVFRAIVKRIKYNDAKLEYYKQFIKNKSALKWQKGD